MPPPSDASWLPPLVAIEAEQARRAQHRDPVHLATGAGIVPDPWQTQVLRSTDPRILLNCCRQSGKSTITSLLGLHTALYTPFSLVLIISRAERQSERLFRKCIAAYNQLGRPVPPKSIGTLHLELTNGSEIVALPGKEETIRSFSAVRLLLIDEAARVDDFLYKSLRPMLAVSAGRLVALSTPWGKRGWWHDAWVSDEEWERYEVPATHCPRISADFLAEEKRALGPWFYEQEYMCQFAEAGDALFSHADVTAALDDGVPPLFGLGPDDDLS